MKQTPLRFLLICACLSQLAACGQKGPLYMPGKPATLPASASAPAKSSAAGQEAQATSSATAAAAKASAPK